MRLKLNRLGLPSASLPSALIVSQVAEPGLSTQGGGAMMMQSVATRRIVHAVGVVTDGEKGCKARSGASLFLSEMILVYRPVRWRR